MMNTRNVSIKMAKQYVCATGVTTLTVKIRVKILMNVVLNPPGT